MSKLLHSTPFPIPKETRDKNPLNGSDAEGLAAAMLVQACHAEVRWGSREEDNKKIDLLLSFDHPWLATDRFLVLCQVKSGGSLGAQHDKYWFTLKKGVIKKTRRQILSILTIWINRKTHDAFWAIISPTTKINKIKYNPIHRLTPALLFDLARFYNKNIHGSVGGKGINISVKLIDFKSKRKRVKEFTIIT